MLELGGEVESNLLEHLKRPQVDLAPQVPEGKPLTSIDGPEVMHHPHILTDDRCAESITKHSTRAWTLTHAARFAFDSCWYRTVLL
jgi:hypothetical protein